MGRSAIETRELHKAFGDHVAVQSLDLDIEEGEVFGFLGPNGAGKTTTVRLLNGLLSSSDGTATVLGLDVASEGAAIRQQSGVLTESPSLYETMSARENLAFFGTTYGLSEDMLSQRIDNILGRFGLGDRADEPVGGYSKGMRQRLAIARCLIHEPPLLFLDEPTAGLDPVAARQVVELIASLSRDQGRTIFMCTHNLRVAQELCDRVGVIDHGALRAMGSPEDLGRGLWQHVSVNVTLTAPLPVSFEFGQVPGVVSMTHDGQALCAQVESDEVIPELVAALVGADARIRAVEPQEHSLEEIYLALQSDVDDTEGAS